MILKKIYEDYDFPIERLLFKEAKRLDLTTIEVNILVTLFGQYKRKRTYTVQSIAKKTDIPIIEVEKALTSLIDKELIKFVIENKDGKNREVFSLDGVFVKIEDLFNNEEREAIKEEAKNFIRETIVLLEEKNGRPLTSYELESIRRWYEDNKYSHEVIIKYINEQQNKISISQIDKYLTQNKLKPIEIDKDVEDVLDAIYKSIK